MHPKSSVTVNEMIYVPETKYTCVGFAKFPTVFGEPSPQFHNRAVMKPIGATELSIGEKDKPLQTVSFTMKVPVTP